MIKNLLLALLVAVSLVTTPMVFNDHITLNGQSDYSQIRAATRLLYIDGAGNGSGVMIAPNRMLTAGHIAAEDSDVSPLMLGTKRVNILRVNQELDLALLEVENGCPCVPLGTLPKVDSDLVLVGFPTNDTLRTQILTIGKYQGITTPTNWVVSTSPGAPGNSGGGLFYQRDGKWYLVGILIQGAGTTIFGMYPQMIFHLTMSVHPDTIKEFLK